LQTCGSTEGLRPGDRSADSVNAADIIPVVPEDLDVYSSELANDRQVTARVSESLP
jgi:hypothetical protein